MKNIVNPRPTDFADALPEAIKNDNGVITGWSNLPDEEKRFIRRGVGYDYEDERNKFIIDMIHTAYLSGIGFLSIGMEVSRGIPNGRFGFTTANRFISVKDALAYAALYPQNAKVGLSPSATPYPQNPRLQGKSFSIFFVGKEEKQQILTDITTRLGSSIKNSAFDTVTTEQAQKASNQNDVDNPDPFSQPKKSTYTVKSNGESFSTIGNKFGVAAAILLDINSDTKRPEPNQADNINGQNLSAGDVVKLPFNAVNARIPEVIPSYSTSRVNQLLEASGRPTGSIPSGLSVIKKDLAEEKRKVDPEVDLQDWTANAKPYPSVGTGVSPVLNATVEVPVDLAAYVRRDELTKVYYNPTEKNYWCVFRTLALNPESYDIGGGDQAAENISSFQFDIAVPEILKFADRDNEINRTQIDPSKVKFVSRYGDRYRPQPLPEGQGAWLLAVSIPQDEVEKLNPIGAKSKSDEAPSVLNRAQNLLADKGVQGEEGLRRAPYSMSELQSTIATAAIVVDRYADELDKEGINPGMMTPSTNVRIRGEDLKRFYSVVERYIDDINLDITINDKIEFVFDSKYKLINVYYNGAQYAGIADPKTGLYTQFGSVSKGTFALVFYANEISALFDSDSKPSAVEFVQKYMYPSPVIKPTDVKNKQEENKNTNKYPEENSGSGLGKNTFEVTPEKKKKTAKAKTKAEAEKEFQRRFNKGKNALGFFTSTLNNAGCETPLAKYLNDAFLIYQLFGGKASIKQIVGVVVKILRDEVIELKKNEELLLQGAGYLDDPESFVRDIEREVNRQFFACFRVLGDILAKEVLEPGGVPPDVQALVKKGLTPPRGIKLGKTPTADLWALWRKQLLKLIIEFVKQLILQAFKQLLLAVSGCGPETVVDQANITRNRNPRVNSPYGIVRINDLVDYAGIDLEEIARELDIQNTFVVRSEFVKSAATNEQLRQLNDDASDLMVDTDVVAILQGSGGQALIDSLHKGFNLVGLNASELSAADQRGIRDRTYSDELITVLLNQVQDSLYPGDVRYATLGLEKDVIVRYFKRLGQLLGPGISLGIERPLDTKEAYCDARDLLAYGLGSGLDVGLEDLANIGDDDSTPVAGGLTKRQLRSQINQEIDSTSFKIELLCELAAKNFDFAFEIQNFWDRIGLADWFLDLLRFIADASRRAQGIQARAICAGMRSSAGTDRPVSSLARLQQTQIYQYYRHYFGDTYPRVGDVQGLNNQFVLPLTIKYATGQVADIEGDHPHYDIGLTKTTIGVMAQLQTEEGQAEAPNETSFGRLQLDYIPRRDASDQKVRVYFNRKEKGIVGLADTIEPLTITSPDDNPQIRYRDVPSELLCEFDLSEDNLPGHDSKYSVKNSLSRIATSLLADNENVRNAQAATVNNINSNLMHIAYGNLTNNKTSKGGTGTRTVATDIATRTFGNTPVDYAVVRSIPSPYLNSFYNVTRTMSVNLYANERVKDRVDDTIEAASIPPFGPSGDPCNLGPDEQNALVTLNAIHQRIFNFVLNVAPLFNNGYSLDTPDTLNMLKSYMANKIARDFQERGMFGYIIDGLDFVSRTCSSTEVDTSGIEFNPALIQDPQEQLEYIIIQMLRKTFYNLSQEAPDNDNDFSGWAVMTKNLFKDIEEEAVIQNSEGVSVTNRKVAYDMLVNYFHSGHSFGIQQFPDTNRRRYNLPDYLDERTPGADEFISRGGALGFSADYETFKNREFLGLVPIPLLVGLQYIYYDKVVSVTDNFSQMAFYAKKRINTADEALRTALEPASSLNYLVEEVAPSQPKTLDELIRDDKKRNDDLNAKLARLREEANRAQRRQQAELAQAGEENRQGAPRDEDVGQNLADRVQNGPPGNQPPANQSTRDMQRQQQEEGISQSERERRAAEIRERIRQEGSQGQQRQQQQQQQQQQQRPRVFPAQVGGRTYNNLTELRADKAKYQSLWEKCNQIRSLKGALEARFGAFADQVSQSEQLYKTTGFNFSGKSDGYQDFVRVGRGETAFRGKIHEIVLTLNRLSSLGISQYGTNASDGGLANQQRAYNSNTDLKISNKDSITQVDINTAALFHPNAPFSKRQAFGQRTLGFLESLMLEGMESTYAGLKDSRETTNFYGRITGAAIKFTGFADRPPPRQLRSVSDYGLQRIDQRAERNDTITGLIASITLKVAEIDEDNLFQDLNISSWDPAQRNRVESIITEMTNVQERARGN